MRYTVGVMEEKEIQKYKKLIETIGTQSMNMDSMLSQNLSHEILNNRLHEIKSKYDCLMGVVQGILAQDSEAKKKQAEEKAKKKT